MTLADPPIPIDPLAVPTEPVYADPRDAFFDTAHLTKDLKRRTVRGGAVTMVAQAAKFVLQIGSTAILARLLIPADFGLVAMVAAITGLISLLGDFGLSAATIQRDHITHSQVNALFWITVAASLLLSLCAACCAPLIAWFYHEPRLIPITLALAATFVFGGLTSQHYAILVRQMRFGAMALVQTIPSLASVIVGIVLARFGYHYWALVVMAIATSAGTAIAAWLACAWRPTLPRPARGLRAMLAFGGHLTGFNLLTYLTRNGDNILIGRVLGAGPLGMYSKAYGLLMLPIQQINAPINGTVLPALSRLQNAPERYRRFFLQALSGVAFVGMPLIAFAFVDAKLLVATILGHQWMGAVPIFRLLAPAAMLGTVNLAPMWIFISLDKTRRQFLWAAVSTPIILAGFAIGLMWGAAGVAASFSVTYGIYFLLLASDACRNSPIRFRSFLGALFVPLAASVSAVLTVIACNLLPSSAPAVKLVVDAPLYALSYVGLCLLSSDGRRLLRKLSSNMEARPV